MYAVSAPFDLLLNFPLIFSKLKHAHGHVSDPWYLRLVHTVQFFWIVRTGKSAHIVYRITFWEVNIVHSDWKIVSQHVLKPNCFLIHTKLSPKIPALAMLTHICQLRVSSWEKLLVFVCNIVHVRQRIANRVSHMRLTGTVEAFWSKQAVSSSSPYNEKYFCHWIQWKHLEKKLHYLHCEG